MRGVAVFVFTLFTFLAGIVSGGVLMRSLAPDSPWVVLLGYALFPGSIAVAVTIVQGVGVIMLPFLLLRWLFASKDEREEEGASSRDAILDRLMSRGVVAVSAATFVVVFGGAGILAAWIGGTAILWGGAVSAAAGAAWCAALVALTRVGWFVLPD